MYLHEYETPIAHRDIKPDNILVQHRFPGDIYVKFGDFGLAQDSCELMTICGTPMYQAPEIYLEWQRYCFGEERSSYNTAVDIWSLGVVVYELMYDLPRYKSSYKNGGAAWCEKIVAEFQQDLQNWPNELGRFPLSSMLVISPDIRYTARECYELCCTASASCQTPTAVAPYSKEGEQMTGQYSPEDHVANDQGTAIWQPGPSADAYATISSYHEGSFIGSEAPPPESLPSGSRATRNRTATSKAPASSSSSARYTQRQEGRSSRREPISSQRPELAHFLEDYSPDPLNSLYVGSSIAAWTEREGSGNRESPSPDGSAPENKPWDTDAQIGQGSGLGPPPQSRVGNQGSVADVSDGEMQLAILLQAMLDPRGSKV